MAPELEFGAHSFWGCRAMGQRRILLPASASWTVSLVKKWPFREEGWGGGWWRCGISTTGGTSNWKRGGHWFSSRWDGNLELRWISSRGKRDTRQRNESTRDMDIMTVRLCNSGV